jgi:predicted DNA binding CopG/RHH family protein
MADKKAINLIIEIKLWQNIKAKAVKKGLTLQEYVTDILKSDLYKND